jgi:hypothetical protein
MNLEEIPPRILEYTGSHFTTIKNLRTASRFRLSVDQLEQFVLILGDVFKKEVEIANVPTVFAEKLKMPKGTAFLLAAECGEQHFSAFEDYFGPVQELIKQWRTWGREFGGRSPAPKAKPNIEALATGGPRRGTRVLEVAMPSVFEEQVSKIEQERTEALDEEQLGERSVPEEAPVSARVPARRQMSGVQAGGSAGIVARAPAVTSSRGTVGHQVAARRERDQLTSRGLPSVKSGAPVRSEVSVSASRPTAQPSGVSRDQFLSQLKTLSIDSLRPDGQPAHARLQQLGQQLQHVLTGNPLDRMPIAHAIRSSALFQLYQEMGQESIRSGQPLDAVVYQRFQTNKPYLLKEEFEAMAHLVKAIQ